MKNIKLVASAGILVIYFSLNIAPLYLTTITNSHKDKKTNVKFLLSNVLSSNNQHNKLLDLILKEKAQVIILQEVTNLWVKALKPLKKLYPHQIIKAQENNFGIAIYSKLPLLNQSTIYLVNSQIPSINVRFKVNQDHYQLITTHPVPPINSSYFHMRNKQLIALRKLVKTKNTIIFGDLNITRWSPFFNKLIDATSLNDCRYSFGVNATWPANINLLRIPIDQCLVSKNIRVQNFETGFNVGSDHLPIIVELLL